MPVSAWPARRILPLKEFSLPARSTGRARVSTSLDHSTKDLRIDRGRSKHNIEGMRQKSAQNSRGERRRQPLFGKLRPGEDEPGDPDQRTDCKSPFQPLSAVKKSCDVIQCVQMYSACGWLLYHFNIFEEAYPCASQINLLYFSFY